MTVDGTTLDLILERKRVKNVNARLRGSTLLVSAPVGMPEEKLEPAVRGLASRLLRRAHAARVNGEGTRSRWRVRWRGASRSRPRSGGRCS